MRMLGRLRTAWATCFQNSQPTATDDHRDLAKDLSKNNLNTEGISSTLLAWGIRGSSGANIERWRVGWTRRRCGFGLRWRRARLGGEALARWRRSSGSHGQRSMPA